jgi:hypothetical protein
MKPIRILPALVAVTIGLAGCGSGSHTSASAPASHGDSPTSAISKINDAFKHLTPAQLQAMKARLPAYMHALEQCAKANGDAQAATLACVRSHGFAPAAP